MYIHILFFIVILYIHYVGHKHNTFEARLSGQ